MCTVILAHRIFDDAPILFAANRDEQLDRPAEPPALREGGPLSVVAPRDVKAGGTWLGVNEAGVLAAITNRYGEPADPNRRSRGELVDRALAHGSAGDAARAIAALEGDDYNGFHLLCVDEEACHLVVGDGVRVTRSQLEPGLVVLTERSLGAADDPRKESVREACRALLEAGEFDEEHLMDVLSQCDESSTQVTCISLPEFGYGTRSSTLLRLGERREMWHADGPPCSTDYEDRTDLLDALFESA